MSGRRAALALFVLWPALAPAQAVVDQAYTAPPGNLGATLAEGFAYCGMTATAGITGYLSRVELNAARRADFLTPWILDIQSVGTNGVPTGTVLSTTTIQPANFYSGTLYGAPSVPLPMAVNLATTPLLNAGDRFAIVLHPQGATGSPGLFAGTWVGNPTNGYAGGEAVYGYQANTLQLQGYDLHFRTLVVPIPEPTGLLALGGIASAAVALRRRAARKGGAA